MQANIYMTRYGDNAGAAWLKRRGGDVKTQGVGYTNGLRFDRSKVRTIPKDTTAAYLAAKHGKSGR